MYMHMHAYNYISSSIVYSNSLASGHLHHGGTASDHTKASSWTRGVPRKLTSKIRGNGCYVHLHVFYVGVLYLYIQYIYIYVYIYVYIYIVQCNVYCAMYIVQCILYCAMYIVQCILCNVYCAMYIVYIYYTLILFFSLSA